MTTVLSGAGAASAPGPAASSAGLSLPPEPRLPGGRAVPVGLQSLLFARYRHRWLPRLRKRHGDVFAVRIAPHRRHLVMISKPEDIKSVFAGPANLLHAGEGNALLGPIMGNHSVLLLDESEHLRIRRLLMPAFHGASLRGYRDLITELTRAEIERWPLDTPLRIHDRMQALTLEIILQVVFGVTDERRLAELRPVVEHVVNVSPLTMVGWFYPRLRTFWPWRKFVEIQQTLDRLLYAEIAERRAAPDLASRTDVLSQLLRLSDPDPTGTGPDAGLTDPELRDNLITLLLAGHETTATALAWAFHELARNQRVLRAGQRAADTQDGDYLEAIAKESLRLHPIIYEVARRLTRPVEIGGYRIPAGSTVMPGIGLVQADPDYYQDPTRFDPARFIGSQPPANTWIPFGGGVRRCLGAGFSLLESSVVLSEVLGRFEVTAVHRRPERPKARNITLAPRRGATVRLRLRDR
ncbi:MAG: cytochrome P450 [Actinomycetota bacterium]|nr:cytochrome P450 [Actinomycetota bacterium]MDQ2957713.1 cytochrome P450 [Actinomycetota bacterium]